MPGPQLHDLARTIADELGSACTITGTDPGQPPALTVQLPHHQLLVRDPRQWQDVRHDALHGAADQILAQGHSFLTVTVNDHHLTWGSCHPHDHTITVRDALTTSAAELAHRVHADIVTTITHAAATAHARVLAIDSPTTTGLIPSASAVWSPQPGVRVTLARAGGAHVQSVVTSRVQVLRAARGGRRGRPVGSPS